MPDSPLLFPSFDLEMQEIASRDLQNTGGLPDYGIPQTLQNIEDIYSRIGQLKSQNPLNRTKPGMIKSEADYMFPSIKEALSPRPRSSDAIPTPFDPVEERQDRYTDSKYYKNLGFLPGRDNEELYGRAQTGWGAFLAGISGAWKLAKFQFVDQLKGWGRLVDGVFSGDLSKIYDQDDLEQVNAQIDQIMNDSPVFMTEHDRNSVFTWANFANIVQQTGFTLGAVSEIAAEELLLTALTISTGGATAGVQGARSASLTASMGKALQRIGRAEEVMMDANRTRKLFGKLTSYTPFTHTFQTLMKGARAEESTAQLALRGFGSFYRDLREANAAFTEARAETSGTYHDLKQSLLKELYDSEQLVTQEKLSDIEKVSREAADANFWANSIIISVSNRLQFDNIFRGFKGASKYMGDVGAISEDAAGYFRRSVSPFTKGFVRTARAEAVPKFFRYFKNNITEALQESLQSVSNEAVQSFYKGNYYNPGSVELNDSINKAIGSQFTTEGAKTFLSGFLTGSLTSPLTRGIPNLYNRVFTSKVQRQQRQQNINNQITALNGFFSKPEGRNAAVQFSISGAMGEAIKNKDIKGFNDLQDESVRSFVRTALETGKEDSLFDRLNGIARGLSKEEFEKAFGIEYSEDSRATASSYIESLRRRTKQIKEVKEDLDYKFINPFVPQSQNTPEENAKIANSRTLFEEAKWHIAYMKDGHLRTSQRQSSILRDLRDQMKEMSYSALSNLTDKRKARDEVKLLRREASLSNDPRVKQEKETRATLLNALLPSIEDGKLDPKTFAEYVNHIQTTEDRPAIEQSVIEENRQRLNDFFALNNDQERLFSNINWLADPKNFADFALRHQQYEAVESVLSKVREAFDKEKLDPIRQAHPSYDIVVNDDDSIQVTPKEGETGTDEELEQIKNEIEEALKQQEEDTDDSEEGDDADPNQAIYDRFSEIYDKLAETGEIDQQDRDFLKQPNVIAAGENNADYRKIADFLANEPQQTPEQPTEGTKKEEEAPKPEEPHTPEDEDAYPHYEGSENPPPPGLPLTAGKTILQEVVDGSHNGKRKENGDVELEGGYSYFRGEITRMFKNFPALMESYDFVIVKDNRLFYDHINSMSKETQDKLDVFNKNSPYSYFIKQKKDSRAPIVVIRDRKTKDFIYFNPYVDGMIATSKTGMLAAFTFDYKRSGFTRDQLSGFLDKQSNQEFKINFANIDPISEGSFFENGSKLRNINEFFEGVDPNHGGNIHISRGLKDVEWNDPENTRNGGAFIAMGNLNKIKLLPSKLSDITIGTERYNMQELFSHLMTEDEAKTVSKQLQKIIYGGVFRPQNQETEKIVVSYEPSKDQKGKFVLKLIRLIDSTPEQDDSRKKVFKDSGQTTPTLLTYLFKGERRMNVMVNVLQDITIPYLEDGKLTSVTMNYAQFLSTNLFTNKARAVHPDGRVTINPVNQYLIFPGLQEQVVGPAETKLDPVVEPLTGEEPRGEVPLTPEEESFVNALVTAQKDEIERQKAAELSQNRYAVPNSTVKRFVADGDNILLTDEDLVLADARIEKIVSTAKNPAEAMDRVRGAGYVLELNFSPGFLAFVQDRIDGKTKRTFSEFRQDTRAEVIDKYNKLLNDLGKPTEPEKPMSATELLKKLREDTANRTGSPDIPTLPEDDIIPKLKDGIDRAVIGNEELQFIRDRFGSHVLNQMAYAANSDYWGYWRNGVITLYKNTQEGVGYHEAWHHFSQMFLTNEQKEKLYAEAAKEFGWERWAREQFEDFGLKGRNMALKEIEERLAEEFRKFAQSGGTKLPVAPVRRNIFQKIWDFLTRLFTGKKTLNDYFTDLYQGNLHSYRPSINNAMWGTLNYGFSVPGPDGKPQEIFDAKEYNVAKGFFNILLYKAFISSEPEYNLKSRNISMASLMGLRSNPAMKDTALRAVYGAVNNQLIKYIDDNVAALDANPASLSILQRMISNFNAFFNESMSNLQIPSNIDDIVDQEEPEVIDISAVKDEDGENTDQNPTIQELEPGSEEAQYSDKILPFQDKGLLAMISKVMRNFIITLPRAEVIYDDEGKIAQITEYKNNYGLPEPCDYHKVISVLGEELAGIFNDDEMISKFNSDELLQRLPEVKFLREALPGFGTEGESYSTQTVMSILRDFNRVLVPVYSAVQLEEGGKIILVEKTKNTENKIKRAWQDNFLRGPGVVRNINTGLEHLDPLFVDKNWNLARRTDNTDRTISNRIEFLAKLGITVSGRTAKTREFRDLMRGDKIFYFADSLRKRLESGQIIENPVRDLSQNYNYYIDQEQITITGESALIQEMIRLESLYSDVVPSNMFVTAKGTKKYSLMLPNMFNIVGDALRKATNRQDISSKKHLAYLTDPSNYYMNNSLVMKSLFNPQGLKRTTFEFGDYNGIEFQVYDKRINKQTFETTGREKLIANINTLLESGAVDIMRTGSSSSFYFYRMREWFHSYVMKTGTRVDVPVVKNVPFSSDMYTKGKPNESFHTAFRGYFFNLLVDELSVMKFAEVPRSQKFSKKVKSWGVFADILSPEMKKKLEAIDALTPDQIRNKAHVHLDEFVAEVQNFFFDSRNKNSLTNKFLAYAEKFGIVSNPSGQPGELINESIKGRYKTSWRDLAANFVLNDFVMNVEYSRIFSGIPQFYADYHKRSSGPVSPGNNANSGSIIRGRLEKTHRNTMAFALGKPFRADIDEFNTRTTTDDFASLDKEVQVGWTQAAKQLGTEDEMKGVIQEYNQAEKKKKPVNDGQAWASLDFYRRFRIQLGNWNFDTDEIEYNKEVLRWKIRTNKYESEKQRDAMQAYIDKYPKTLSVFNIIKLQYNGPQKGEGLMLPVFHKYAVAPLIPSAFIDTPLEDMHNWMLNGDIDYVTAESGTKNFSTDPMQFWSDPKNRDSFEATSEPLPDKLFSVYLKEQIKTSNEIKKETTWGTQIRSLWLSNRFNNGKATPEVEKLFNDYHQDLENLIETERQELFREFGISEEGDQFKITNAKAFVETLKKQSDIRNLNSNVKQAIGYDEVTGSFTTPLEIITNRQAVVDLIGGMIFRKMIRIKSNGDMLIQMSSTGTIKKGDNELRFYRAKFDAKGTFVGTLPAECKVAFNSNFAPLLRLKHPDGKRIATVERLNQALKNEDWTAENSREITIVAYRFPTEGPNSMEFMHVAEFLPENAGSTIIVPREIVIKVGSDFDHDKLNAFRPAYNKEGKVIGEEAEATYRKALDRLLKLQKREESLSALIQILFDNTQEMYEDEENIEIDIDGTPMSDEDRHTLKAYIEAKHELKGYYTNQAVNAYIKSLSSPEMFMQLIKPNTTEEVKALALDMAKRAGLEGFGPGGVQAFVNTQIFDYTNNHIKFLQNVQGRSDLAVFAVLNKMLQNLQVTGTKFNKEFINTYPQFSKAGKRNARTTIATTPHLLSKDERANFITDEGMPVGYTEDIEGETISHMISELMNATVDIEKDAFYIGLGINRYNKGITALLLLMRVPLKRISAFLQQPILKEYYRRQDIVPFFRVDFDPTAPAVYATNVNARQMLGLKNRDMLERFIATKQGEEHPEVFNYENLLKNVGRPEWRNANQDIVFAHFLALQRLQKYYMKIQAIVTTDTKKVASPIGVEMSNFNVEDLRASQLISDENIERLQNNSYTSPFTMKEMLSKVFATVMPVGYSELFINKASQLIKESDLFITQDQMLKLERTLANDYMAYILLEKGEYKGQQLRQYVASQISKKLNKNNMVARLLDMQQAHPRLFSFYSLTSKLRSNISRRNPNIQNAELLRGSDNSTESQEVFISEFTKLINFTGREIPGEEYTADQVAKIREFFQDLAIVAFGQSGFNKSLLYMTDILPLTEINPIAIKAMNEYKNSISKDPDYERQFITAFLKDFAQENPSFDLKGTVAGNQEPWRGKYLNKPVRLQKPEGPKPPERKFFRTSDIIKREQVKDDQGTLFIFGDNLLRQGMTGQAKEMRGEPNAIGIATKRKPSGDNKAYFSDNTLEENKVLITKDIDAAITEFRTGGYQRMIVPQIGVGLAKLPTKAPLTWQHLQDELKRMELVVNGGDVVAATPIDATPTPEPTTEPEQPPTGPGSYTNHSGGAVGSDSEWDRIGRTFGVVNHNHYWHGTKTPTGNVQISDEQLEEGWQHVLKANKVMNRRPEAYKSLLSRNWFQVKNADAVFAIIEGFDRGLVKGGTGWAVQMAIDEAKPVYVFDQSTNAWYIYQDGAFYETETPTLTKNFAGIGTRKINAAGRAAITAVYEKTFGNDEINAIINDKDQGC